MTESEVHEKIVGASRTIFSFCMARTRNREEAEDLSQDILCELMRSVHSLRNDRAFYGFMWAVAGNVYKRWCRRRAVPAVCELPDEIPTEVEFLPDTGEGGDDILLLRRELTLLAEKYRRAVILYYVRGKCCAEIADALSVSESTVKYLLFKSRKILKEGMTMERNLGTLSYNPKSLIPMYSGQGPNRFWDFMQSKIRQNIAIACYNDALTPEQISLETGIPLPYLDDDIRALTEKAILLKEGPRYKTNVIIITEECEAEIGRAAAAFHKDIAARTEAFLARTLPQYKAIGFYGSDFSENTLRWQLTVILFRMLFGVDFGKNDAPVTGWGESAYTWCVEKPPEARYTFCYCGVSGKRGDTLYFFDYTRGGKGDHHDFYGRQLAIDLFCGICRRKDTDFSEYDLETVAELVRKGYALHEDSAFLPAVPVYTRAQYDEITHTVCAFVREELVSIIRVMDDSAAKILSQHTPKHLQAQVSGIAAMDKFVNAICIPAGILIEGGVLSTDWHPKEMPTTFAVLEE